MERAQWQRDDRFIPSRMMVDKKEEEEKKRGTREKTKKGHIAASSSSSWREDACRTKKRASPFDSTRVVVPVFVGVKITDRCGNLFFFSAFFFLSLSLSWLDGYGPPPQSLLS